MISPTRHPKNAINAALDALDPQRFAVEEVHRGHRWGVVRCLACGDIRAVWSSPRVPENNAHDITAFARKHRHARGENDEANI